MQMPTGGNNYGWSGWNPLIRYAKTTPIDSERGAMKTSGLRQYSYNKKIKTRKIALFPFLLLVNTI